MSEEITKLTKEDKKRYKIISKIISIFDRIGSVFCWIGMVGCVIGGVLSAAVLQHIEINTDENFVKVFDQEIKFDLDKEEISINDETVKFSISSKDKAEIKEFLDSGINTNKISAAATIACVLGAVACVFGALILGSSAKFFKNLSAEDTPFIEENIELLHKIFKYLIISAIVIFVVDLVLEFAILDGKTNINIVGSINIGAILIVYVAEQIFKHGYALENKKAAKKEA